MEFTVLQQIYYETLSITRTGFTAFLNPNGDIWWDNNGQLLTYYRMQTLFILANIQAKALAQVSQRTVQAWRCAARRHWRIQGVVMVAFRITENKSECPACPSLNSEFSGSFSSITIAQRLMLFCKSLYAKFRDRLGCRCNKHTQRQKSHCSIL